MCVAILLTIPRYEYVNNRMHRLGANAWLLYTIVLFETLIEIKFSMSIQRVSLSDCLPA